MSGSPYNGQGGPGQGQGQSPSFNPALLSANAALANFTPTYNTSTPSPFPNLAPSASITQRGNFSPEQLASLTEFHRQSPQQTTTSPVARAPQEALISIMPPMLVQALQGSKSNEHRTALINQWATSDRGRETIRQAQMNASASGSSIGSGPGQQTTASPGQVFARLPTASPSSRPAALGSSQPPQSLPPASTSSPEKKTQSTVQSPGQGKSALPETTKSRSQSPKKPEIPITQAFSPSSFANLAKPLLPPMAAPPAAPARPQYNPRPPAPAAPPTYSNVQWIRPPPSTNYDYATRPAAPRRREEGMRGSMRSECESPPTSFEA